MSRKSQGITGPNMVIPVTTESNQGEPPMTQVIAESLSHQQGGHMRSAVERIAGFAAAARPEQVTNDTRRLFKRNILDSLGCAIAALQGQPFQALREQFEEYRA